MPRGLFAGKPCGGLADIDVTSAHAATKAGDVRLVDVRESDEFAAGHPVGAINLPLSSLPGALDELPDGPLVLSCRSGSRSSKAGGMAIAAGRSDVRNVTGGFIAWEAAGLLTEDAA